VARPLGPGANLGRYELQALIARGRLADVWLAAFHGAKGFSKQVVLKTLHPADRGLVVAVASRARAAARLNHHRIAQVLDLGEVDGRFFIAIEHVPGLDLGRLLRECHERDRPIPRWFALQVAADICEGLHHAHQLQDERGRPIGIAHGGLSPANVMVTSHGIVKVLDFGIAGGQEGFLAPEGDTIDPRCDIFALGVILSELLTAAPGGSIPPPLEGLLVRAVAPDPRLRQRSAEQLRRDLLGYLTRMDTPHPPRDVGAFVGALVEEPRAPPGRLTRWVNKLLGREEERTAPITPPTSSDAGAGYELVVRTSESAAQPGRVIRGEIQLRDLIHRGVAGAQVRLQATTQGRLFDEVLGETDDAGALDFAVDPPPAWSPTLQLDATARLPSGELKEARATVVMAPSEAMVARRVRREGTPTPPTRPEVPRRAAPRPRTQPDPHRATREETSDVIPLPRSTGRTKTITGDSTPTVWDQPAPWRQESGTPSAEHDGDALRLTPPGPTPEEGEPPTTAAEHLDRGMTLLQRGDRDGALSHFRIAATLAPRDPLIQANLKRLRRIMQLSDTT